MADRVKCHRDHRHRARITRRSFLRAAGAAAAGLLPAVSRRHGSTGAAPTPAGAPQVASGATVALGETPDGHRVYLPLLLRPSSVAIAQAHDYDRERVRRAVRDLLDGTGGLEGVVHAGDRVAIKVNLTGGTRMAPLPGVSPIDSYVTHPEVVRALGECVRDAGAGEIYIVEAVWDWASYTLWGYEEVAAAIGATLIDLNDSHPYGDFSSTSVGEGWLVYPDFIFNHVLEEVDAFISVAKQKCHWSCGVTHSLKNSIGLVPARFYPLDETHGGRWAFHGTETEMAARLPRVIVDLLRARPIHLALIDGIRTMEGGEGPWIGSPSPVEPGVLVASRDPVAADAVATAVMGFDPAATHSTPPFLRSDNHLNIAAGLGLGINRLDQIEVIGPPIQDVRCEFRPA
jgi:uncharacterized protein (DUF362 family)